jgi:hypothetical protein
MGDAESILCNKLHLREIAQKLIRRGIIPKDGGWDRWLGRNRKACAETAAALERQRAMKKVARYKNRDRGR